MITTTLEWKDIWYKEQEGEPDPSEYGQSVYLGPNSSKLDKAKKIAISQGGQALLDKQWPEMNGIYTNKSASGKEKMERLVDSLMADIDKVGIAHLGARTISDEDPANRILEKWDHLRDEALSMSKISENSLMDHMQTGPMLKAIKWLRDRDIYVPRLPPEWGEWMENSDQHRIDAARRGSGVTMTDKMARQNPGSVHLNHKGPSSAGFSSIRQDGILYTSAKAVYNILHKYLQNLARSQAPAPDVLGEVSMSHAIPQGAENTPDQKGHSQPSPGPP